jgi:hypothetical protein
MEIRQDGYVWNAPHILRCSCGVDTFEVQFRFSESIQLYHDMGGTGHKPDMMVVVCASCEQEITITETEAKMPPQRPYKPEAYQFKMDDQIRRSAGVPPGEYYTSAPRPGATAGSNYFVGQRMRVKFDPATGQHYVRFEEE